jgi:YfiH family protein
MNPDWIVPDWPAPAAVRAFVTTRAGGVSEGPDAAMNLGAHVGDSPEAVMRNRTLLRNDLPGEPFWLDQVHGVAVAEAGADTGAIVADASVARRPGEVCAIMTADCLPVLFCNAAGSVVAAAHAGWRGLAAGVLEACIARMRVPASTLMAWLGPAIGPGVFEVGSEVRAAFVRADLRAEEAFRPAAQSGKWLADLFLLASIRLARAGVGHVSGGGLCTYSNPGRFYSYRRDGRTGRFASLIWMER